MMLSPKYIRTIRLFASFVIVLFLALSRPVMASTPTATPGATATPEGATAADLVRVTNQARVAFGLTPLNVSATLMGTAQWTAEYMADNQIGGHIGGVSDRVKATGYGGGTSVWATENIMNGQGLSAETIVLEMWSDDMHAIPVKNPIYCDVGAGVATDKDGQVYYVLHAAYSEYHMCGPYIAPDGSRLPNDPTVIAAGTQMANGTLVATIDMAGVSQLVLPVYTVTPNAKGELLHTVRSGQSLWSIAIAYGTRIKEIQAANGYPESWNTVYIGQKLRIPVKAVAMRSSTPESEAAQSTIAPGSIQSTPLPPGSIANTIITPAGVASQADSGDRTIQALILGAVGLGLALVVVGILTKKK